MDAALRLMLSCYDGWQIYNGNLWRGDFIFIERMRKCVVLRENIDRLYIVSHAGKRRIRLMKLLLVPDVGLCPEPEPDVLFDV